MPWVLGALAVLVAFGVGRALLHANELFCLSIRDGRSLVVRGRLPKSLQEELTELVPGDALIVGVRESRQARLRIWGVDAATEQRIRNVFGISRFRDLKTLGTTPRGPRNLGQRLGWVWLSWMLER